MNPYTIQPADPTPEVDPEILRDAISTARGLASSGSVVGSIAKKLRANGLDPANADRIATDAVIARSRLERIAGICLTIFGLVVAFSGYVLYYYLDQSIQAVRRIPFVVAMVGLFFAMLGVAKLFHRSKLKRHPQARKRLR